MRRVVCPGSFDPVTCGHLDIVARAGELFDEVIVAVLVNPSKQGLFSVDERISLIEEAVADKPSVTVASFSGLLADFCREREAMAIVKGVRAAGDLDTELRMAHMNRRLSGLQTVLLPADPRWAFVASSLVKEVARFGGDISGLVPSNVLNRLRGRLGQLPGNGV